MEGGRPIQIVTTGENHTFILDEDALTELLLQDHLKDRFIVVVSVAGAFRKGKSFLLDFFLRYMYSKVNFHLEILRLDQMIITRPFFVVLVRTQRIRRMVGRRKSTVIWILVAWWF